VGGNGIKEGVKKGRRGASPTHRHRQKKGEICAARSDLRRWGLGELPPGKGRKEEKRPFATWWGKWSWFFATGVAKKEKKSRRRGRKERSNIFRVLKKKKGRARHKVGCARGERVGKKKKEQEAVSRSFPSKKEEATAGFGFVENKEKNNWRTSSP